MRVLHETKKKYEKITIYTKKSKINDKLLYKWFVCKYRVVHFQ